MTIENTTPERGYSLPAPTNLLSEDVVRLIAAVNAIDVDVANILLALSAKASISHGHSIADVTGLSAALAGFAPVIHTHTIGSLTGVSISGPADGQVLIYSGGQWTNAPLSIASVPGLSAALASLQSQIDALDDGTF